MAVGSRLGPLAPVQVESPFKNVILDPGVPDDVVHEILNRIFGSDVTAELLPGATVGGVHTEGAFGAPSKVALPPVTVFPAWTKSFPTQLATVKVELSVEELEEVVVSGGLKLMDPDTAQVLKPCPFVNALADQAADSQPRPTASVSTRQRAVERAGWC